MASKIYNFETPSEYSYDVNKILVSGGLVSLKEDLSSIYARWHLNETTGAIVSDSSGNGRNGTPVNNPTSVVGKLNNCLSFNGTNQYVDCGDIVNFERTQPCSYEFLFNTTASATRIVFSKMIMPTPLGMRIVIIDGKINFGLYANSSNILQLQTNSISNDGNWHHCIITYDGSSLASGVKFYIDNVLQATTIMNNNLNASILNTATFRIAGRMDSVYFFSGKLDEGIIYNKVLSASEVAFRYNSGVGRENWYYPTDKPTIKPTSSWQVSGLSTWFGYVESLGAGNEGSIGYQLSNDDGVNWRYWNGSAWAITTEVNYNSAAVVGAHISSFSIINEKILFRAFLISDGNQKVELDTIEITATVGFPPNVFAGADKNCKDHETKKPYSDAVINDPDGQIENSTAYRKIESQIWTQILKGEYGTLQDAIRNYEYTFDNLGTITCELKIVDEQAFENTDSMIETVSKYQITFNIKDTDGNHLGNVLCNFDDGLGWLMKNSPFTYEFEWKSGNYLCTFDKTGFISQSINVPVSDHTENITLQRLTVDPSAIADAVWDELKGSHNLTNSFGKETQDIKNKTDLLPIDPASESGLLAKDLIVAKESTCQDIKGKTQLIPPDPTSETNAIINKNVIISEININEIKIDSIISSLNDLVANIWSYSTRTLTSFGTLIADIWANITRTLSVGTRDTQIDAIKVKTDNLPVNPASETGLLAKETTVAKDSTVAKEATLILKSSQATVDLIKTQTDKIPNIKAESDKISRILGLSQENYRLFDIVYYNSLITSAKIKIYNSASDCNGDVNPLAIYNVSATYSEDGLLTSYKVIKNS